jgi:protein gp37
MGVMGKDTGISWCDATFNPFWGCAYVSPGCEHCYAKREATRFGFSSLWGAGSMRRFFGEAHWKEPMRWNREVAQDLANDVNVQPRLVFCGSMCDVFESNPEIPQLNQERDRLIHLIQETPYLTWLLLTKRPENIAKFFGPVRHWARNIMIGITGENQKFLERRLDICTKLGLMPFISIEPMLEPVLIMEQIADRTNWVIVGGESGPAARAMEVGWARQVRDMCILNRVPFFFKQWGFHVPLGQKVDQLDGETWHQTPWGDR